MKSLKFALAMGLLFLAATAYADVFQTYNLAWSGASFGNNATATGQITLDLTTLPNPGVQGTDLYNDIASLTVTVVGASLGNGNWAKADLQGPPSTFWWTGGVALNMNQQLVGQPTLGNPWGTPDGNSGDFNLFFTNGGPFGSNYFTLTTSGGFGDPMLLTSFAPAVPEPSSLLLLGTGLAGAVGLIRRKINL